MNIIDLLQKFDDEQWVAITMGSSSIGGNAKAMREHCLEKGWNIPYVYSITKIEIQDNKPFIHMKYNL